MLENSKSDTKYWSSKAGMNFFETMYNLK